MNVRTRGYYKRRAIVRFVFWSSVILVLSLATIEVMATLTWWWYGIPKP